MKRLITLMALTLSVGAFAQERVVLTSKSASVNSDRAVLVRTAQTPDKVEITFQVPMANSVCEDYRTRIVPRMCVHEEPITRTRQVCENVPVPPSNPNAPRGPRYNPPTRRVCKDVTERVGTRRVTRDCSYTESYCARYGTSVSTESDKVKIKFKNLPALGGSEEETFSVTAKQRSYDGANVEYDITPITTAEGRTYEVKKKGILGYDSYVIESK